MLSHLHVQPFHFCFAMPPVGQHWRDNCLSGTSLSLVYLYIVLYSQACLALFPSVCFLVVFLCHVVGAYLGACTSKLSDFIRK